MAKAVISIIIIISAIALYHHGVEFSWESLPSAIQWHIFPQLQSTYKLVTSLVTGSNSESLVTAERMYTKDELKTLKFSHLAIVGEVYDVTKGERHYGKDGHYNFFTGESTAL